MSTTTCPWSRATSRRCSTTPERTSTHRSARGRPVTTVRSRPTARRTEPNFSASMPPAVTRAADSRPETSSRMPSCWATAPPYGSASTRIVGTCRRASSAARPVATVVRPGAPAGPQTATTRPARAGDRRLVVGVRHAGANDGVGRLLAGGHGVGQRLELVLGDERADPDPGRPQAGGVERGPARHDRDRSDGVRAEVLDRRDVEAGRVDTEHGDVGLAGTRGGQQVVDVDAALEHHDPGRARPAGRARSTPRRRRPRRPGRRPRQPLWSTVRPGSSSEPTTRKKRTASSSVTPSTSWRRPLDREGVVEGRRLDHRDAGRARPRSDHRRPDARAALVGRAGEVDVHHRAGPHRRRDERGVDGHGQLDRVGLGRPGRRRHAGAARPRRCRA